MEIQFLGFSFCVARTCSVKRGIQNCAEAWLLQFRYQQPRMELPAMKPKLYLETTIPSYLTSRPSRDLVVAAKQQVTRQWWEQRRHEFDVCVSQFVIDEASAGDVVLASARLQVIKGLPLLDVLPEVAESAGSIRELGFIPERAGADATHIAIAAVHGVDFLLTWNCRHIANAAIARRVVRACESHGFECPVICTPDELLGEEP